MTKLFTSVLLFFSAHLIFSQCQFMSERDFQAAKYRLRENRGNINAFQSAMDLNRVYCLTSSQAREIANYLANDRDKFDFLKSCFTNISDKENFTDVMDVFRLFSSAIRLYHQTLGANGNSQPISQQISSNPSCPYAMDLNSYNNLKIQLRNQIDDRQKASSILSSANQCMTTQQIISLVSNIRDEIIRIDVMKRIYPFVFDRENYVQAANALTANYRTQFLSFLQNPTAPPVNPPVQAQPTALAEIDFNNFLSTLRKQSFEKDKDNYIKTYMKNAYLNVGQVNQILKILNFDNTKLDIAKFLYDRCLDKQNYFQVTNELQFSSSKTELNDYVKSRK